MGEMTAPARRCARGGGRYNPRLMGSARLLTPAFVLGFAANFLHSLAFHSYVHLPGFLDGLGADEFTIGVAMGVMALFAIVARPAVGRLIDGWGRRPIVLVGSVVNVAACLAYLFVETIGPWLFFVRILHGFAEAMLYSVLFTIAADVVPSARRTEGIALFGVSGLLPLSIAGLVGDAILSSGTYDQLFWFTIGAAALGLLCGIPLPDSRPPKDEGGLASRSFLTATFAPGLLPVWMAGLAFSLAVASYFTFLKTYVIHRDLGSVGAFFTAYTLAAVGLRVFFGWVPDRFGPRRLLAPAIAIQAVGVALLAFASNDVTVGVAGVLCGIGHGFAFPIASALAVERARPSERGAVLSTFTALFDMGMLIGGPALGAIVTASDYPTMFLSAAGIALAGAVGFVAWDRAPTTDSDPDDVPPDTHRLS